MNFAVKYNGGFELNHVQSEFMVPEELYSIMASKISEIKKMSYEGFMAEYGDYGVDKEMYDAIQNLSTAKLENGASLNNFLNSYEPLRQIATAYLKKYFDNYYEDIKDKAWKNPAVQIGDKKVLKEDDFEYNEATGFFHKYDEVLYANDPYGYGVGYGPILYADISSSTGTRTGILDMPFTTMEYRGNKVLTVSEGRENYKLFIESYEGANSMSIQVLGGGIECSEELVNLIGYATIANGDGAVPVTMEVKEFLQKYAINQVLFMDGNGWAERAETPYQSTEDGQWLFACGYYE